ncbi:MAG: ATPase [Kosmotoga sp.]|nr:MAG: ATPase [Kosmotoga sp.]
MYWIIGIATVLVFSTIILGIIFSKRKNLFSGKKNRKRLLGINLVSFFSLLLVAVFVFIPQSAAIAQTTETATNQATTDSSSGLGFIAAALATGIAAIGAGIGVGMTSSSAIGAISEKPDIFGRTLIFAGLAEGIAIYGLIVSVMILGKI